MLNPKDRSRAFNFALKAQEYFGILIGLSVLWSIYALLFSNLENFFIAKVLLTMISIGFGTITPLIDFNESHATNPLWTGHARFHLVWQVNAMILTAFLCLILLWFFDSFFNILRAGGGTKPHDHIIPFDKRTNLEDQKYSLVYYLSVGDQNCNEPGILKLYEPDKEILPSDGMIVIIPANRKHSAIYNGKKDRIMIGCNFYSL